MEGLCLTMIVRDEADWVEAALVSAVELGVDSFLIADTGSEDDTVEVIESFLEEHLGLEQLDSVIHLPWEGHARTRTKLLRRARDRADWLLLMDADMELEGVLGELVADCNYGTIGTGNLAYGLPLVVKGDKPWCYKGAAHSFLALEDGSSYSEADAPISIIDRRPGAFRPGKLEEDAAELEHALELDPTDSRSSFYLAQTYQNLGRSSEAIREYGRRALMRGYPAERYVAKLRRARMLEATDERAALAAYLDAWQDRPSRAEALYGAARLSRIAGGHHLALMFARQASELKPTTDRLFVERGVYDWGIRFELGSGELHAGDVIRGRQILRELRAEKTAPESYLFWIDELLEGRKESDHA